MQKYEYKLIKKKTQRKVGRYEDIVDEVMYLVGSSMGNLR